MRGFKHLSPKERHVIYRKLGVRVSARPDGATDIEGSLGTNILSTENEIVLESLTNVRERFHRGESVISLATPTLYHFSSTNGSELRLRAPLTGHGPRKMDLSRI